jgi:polyisoprenyl-teichoic acid--peptidoglycan teichoic acid transferase
VFEDIPRPGLWKRLMIGAALVVFASAGATSVAGFHEVDKVVNALRQQPELKLGTEIAHTDPGKPQTIMLLGSDRRPPKGDPAAGGARSDTIMLIRLDPSKNATAMMSLPRDLKVQIPGHGSDKINAAYELGGPKLALKTVKLLTGLPINHVINVDFRGFWASVDAVGCVYADIDRRYFNNSAGYSYINVEPGYQRMCGRKALQYVRFRHEDNDLVRSARQQDFLRQAKQQIGVSKLIGDRDRLVRIFGRYTTSDIRSSAEVLRLLKLAVFSVGQPIREVHFQGAIGKSYVTTTYPQVKKLVHQFLGVEQSAGPRGKLKPKGRHRNKKGGGDLGLEKADVAGKDQAVQAVQQGAGSRLPVLYPTVRTQGSLYAGPPRVYKLRGTDGRRYGAYRIVIKRGLVGEYYGLQGTTWRNPPILADATETRKIGRRKYELHYDGDRLRLVAWHTRKAAYWVSNTLLLTLSERQMLAIARSARPL